MHVESPVQIELSVIIINLLSNLLFSTLMCCHGNCGVHVMYCRYKILFLDVLFPLNVNKFIFVDADQVRYIFVDIRQLMLIYQLQLIKNQLCV